jgi:hypothetical protein
MPWLFNFGSTSLASFDPLVREKFSDLIGGHGGEAPENVGEVFLRVDAVAAAALDEGVNDGAAPARLRMSNEEPPALADG